MQNLLCPLSRFVAADIKIWLLRLFLPACLVATSSCILMLAIFTMVVLVLRGSQKLKREKENEFPFKKRKMNKLEHGRGKKLTVACRISIIVGDFCSFEKFMCQGSLL